MKNYDAEHVAKKVIEYCVENHIKEIYISGNGAAGKSELSKSIVQLSSPYGCANLIDMDDFVVDTELRKNAKVEWVDVSTGETRSGKYSTNYAASYFLQNIKAILCNLERGNNYWHWPKRAKSKEECCTELKADAVFTIIEGVGSVYLHRDQSNSLSLFIRCSKDIEIQRRIKRAKYSNEKNRADVERQYEERNSQFEALIVPYESGHDIILNSLLDYSLDVLKDDKGVFSE